MKTEKEEIVIEEFKSSTPDKKYDFRGERNYIIPGVFCLVFLLAVLAGMFLLKMPVVLVCTILVLESLLGVCLHYMPIWVHGMEMLISITAGIIFGQAGFMIIAAGVYLAVILTLHFMNSQEV